MEIAHALLYSFHKNENIDTWHNETVRVFKPDKICLGMDRQMAVVNPLYSCLHVVCCWGCYNLKYQNTCILHQWFFSCLIGNGSVYQTRLKKENIMYVVYAYILYIICITKTPRVLIHQRSESLFSDSESLYAPSNPSPEPPDTATDLFPVPVALPPSTFTSRLASSPARAVPFTVLVSVTTWALSASAPMPALSWTVDVAAKEDGAPGFAAVAVAVVVDVVELDPAVDAAGRLVFFLATTKPSEE